MKNDNYFPLIHQFPPSPIVGFILQKDVYTTNLLYANDQFPTRSLRTTLPFRTGSGKKHNNPSSSLTILRQNGFISENSEEENIFYLRNTFRPKKLNKMHLKFPLPKIKPVPLTSSVLREDICKHDIRIKYMEDDLNITSKFGKKIIYNLKENSKIYKRSFSNNKDNKNLPKKDKKIDIKSNVNAVNEPKSKNYENELRTNKLLFKKYKTLKIKLNKNNKNIVPVKQAIYEINSDLKLLE